MNIKFCVTKKQFRKEITQYFPWLWKYNPFFSFTTHYKRLNMHKISITLGNCQTRYYKREAIIHRDITINLPLIGEVTHGNAGGVVDEIMNTITHETLHYVLHDNELFHNAKRAWWTSDQEETMVRSLT